MCSVMHWAVAANQSLGSRWEKVNIIKVQVGASEPPNGRQTVARVAGHWRLALNYIFANLLQQKKRQSTEL